MAEVKLVSYTKPLIDGVETIEDYTAYVARVSNPENQLNNETAERLLRYLARNKHWSPFEMVDLTMEIKTTRDIARQILRHRSFVFQEFSQRYAVPDLKSFQIRETRLQDSKNRQNSIKIESGYDFLKLEWEQKQKDLIEKTLEVYQWAIDNNIAKEVARSVLMEGSAPTTMYMKGSLRSWIHYCELRMGNGTQLEHQEIAELCWDKITEEVPSLKNILNIED